MSGTKPAGNSPDDSKSPPGVWVQVFRTGTHTDSAGKTQDFGTADLDALVESYEATKDQYKPVLRIGGHDGGVAPSGGKVVGLRRSGEFLEALFDAAPVVAEAIRGKLYNGVSAGIRFGARIGDKTLGRFLDHVAILGHRIPAVKGLNGPDGLSALFGADDDDGEMAIFTSQTEDNLMDEKLIQENVELKARVKELEGDVQTKETQFSEAETAHKAEIEQINAKHAEALKAKDEKIAEFETAQAKAEVEAVVDGAVRGGKLAPVSRDAQVAVGLNLRTQANFSEDDSAYATWKKGIEDAPKVMDFNEKAHAGGDSDEERLTKEEADFEEGLTQGAEFQKSLAGDSTE